MDLLLAEVERVEAVFQEFGLISGEAGEAGTAAKAKLSGKDRIDMIGQMVRTLEKLLDTRRIEALAGEPDVASEEEGRRMRDDLLRRLRLLDRQRREAGRSGEGGMFGPDETVPEPKPEAEPEPEGAAPPRSAAPADGGTPGAGAGCATAGR
ncbi:hypothetical protein [Fulvimarina endophytica]|nr:hypothetical protein [Fulvimarina endophytica]